METNLKLSIEIRARKNIRGTRVVGYIATYRDVEGHGRTREDAKADLLRQIDALAVEAYDAPAMLFDLDGSGVWQVERSHDGWGYTHFRHVGNGARSYGSSVFLATGTTRDQAIDAMRAHWYSQWIEPVVRGIVGLCTTRRMVVCPRQHVSESEGPVYQCGAPGCGVVVKEAA